METGPNLSCECTSALEASGNPCIRTSASKPFWWSDTGSENSQNTFWKAKGNSWWEIGLSSLFLLGGLISLDMILLLALCRQPEFKQRVHCANWCLRCRIGGSPLPNGKQWGTPNGCRKLTPTQSRYSIVERECLAIKKTLDALKYLLGYKFRLITDHAPLRWMSENKEKNAWVTSWFLALQNIKVCSRT